MITIGADFISSMLAYVGIVFDDLKPLIFVICGFLLGFYFVERAVGIFTQRKEKPWHYEYDPEFGEYFPEEDFEE
jgi:F0F1-type ATP synthase assembly protein I